MKEVYDINLTLSKCKHCMDFDNDDCHSQVYICNVSHDQTPILQEGLAMKWVTLGEIENIELGFDQEPIVVALRNELLHN